MSRFEKFFNWALSIYEGVLLHLLRYNLCHGRDCVCG